MQTNTQHDTTQLTGMLLGILHIITGMLLAVGVLLIGVLIANMAENINLMAISLGISLVIGVVLLKTRYKQIATGVFIGFIALVLITAYFLKLASEMG